MHKMLLDLYFASAEYAETEKSDKYLTMVDFLQTHLDENEFLEFESYLHEEIIYIVENAFFAGYQAMWRNTACCL